MSSIIATVSTRRLEVPLARPWSPTVRRVAVLAVDVTDSEGATGHGFSWVPAIGAGAVQALLDEDIREFAIGQPTDPEALWPKLWRHLHEAGSGGLTTIAIAGLDLALWDLAARRADVSISALLGERRREVEVYASGINFYFDLRDVRAQARRWARRGYRAVKMKVGRSNVAHDVARVAAVREVMGPECRIMVDANQRWTVDEAVAALAALREFDLTWIEEPLRADDLLGHRRLRDETDIPIALGENLYTSYRFQEYIAAGVVDIIQPNIVRVGGITPFRKIAALAVDGIQLTPHLLTELSGQLALTLPDATLVEDADGADFSSLGLLAQEAPVTVADGLLRSTGQPGLGLEFGEVDHVDEPR